jgi:Acyl-CoA dehydrogenase, N-terminal domain/Acyl-CoA dehydrogenase, middle domain/Acyl-CoA dehydrogenase, C-terminal domain
VALTLKAVDRGSADLLDLRLQVRRFLNDEIDSASFVPEADAWMSGIDTAFSRRLAARGWVGMTVPVEHGGHGRTALERFVVTEELLSAGAPVAAHWIADRQIAPSILRNGSAAQKSAYLPGIVAGQRFFAIGMSEPDAGSDLAAVRTSAVESHGGWRLSGTKLWTSAAHVATNLVVLARSGASSDRHVGLSQFIVDLPHADVHVRPIITIDGGHHFNEVVFDDAQVPETSLLGSRGDGWRQVTDELAHERSGPERVLSTLPLLIAWSKSIDHHENPFAGVELGRLVGRMAVLRELSLSVAERLHLGENPTVEAALVKDIGTTFEGEIVDAIRRHAAREPDTTEKGFSRLLAKALLRTPAFTLRGGTSEILRSVIAKGL